jgi:hypothetical protein
VAGQEGEGSYSGATNLEFNRSLTLLNFDVLSILSIQKIRRWSWEESRQRTRGQGIYLRAFCKKSRISVITFGYEEREEVR